MDPPLAPRLARLTDSKVQILARLEDRQPTRLVSAQSIWAETGNLVHGIYIQGLTNSLEIEIGSRSVLFTQASVSELVMIWLLIRNSSPFSPIFQTILSIKKKRVQSCVQLDSCPLCLHWWKARHIISFLSTELRKKKKNKTKKTILSIARTKIFMYIYSNNHLKVDHEIN